MTTVAWTDLPRRRPIAPLPTAELVAIANASTQLCEAYRAKDRRYRVGPAVRELRAALAKWTAAQRQRDIFEPKGSLP